MKALYARCEQCGCPDGVLFPGMDMYLCPECTFEAAHLNAAQEQLEGLMAEALKAWLHVWKFQKPQYPDLLTAAAASLAERLEMENTQ